jgi:hypothetical protein
LKTFINAQAFTEKALFYQTTIHITFLYRRWRLPR